jgi:hypothetical protein
MLAGLNWLTDELDSAAGEIEDREVGTVLRWPAWGSASSERGVHNADFDSIYIVAEIRPSDPNGGQGGDKHRT